MDLQLNVGVCDWLGFHNTSNKILKGNCRTRLLPLGLEAVCPVPISRGSVSGLVDTEQFLAWGWITLGPDLEPRMQTQMPRTTRGPVSKASWWDTEQGQGVNCVFLQETWQPLGQLLLCSS